MPVPRRRANTPKTVTGRVFSILGCFSREQPALTLSELGTQTGLPTSTVFRLSRELVAWGGLQRTGDHYRIGPRITEFAYLADADHSIQTACVADQTAVG
jgi:DNA-binding IclR family transcriptional regulator